MKPPNTKPPDIASASLSDTLATLKVNPETGLTPAEVDTRRKENGYNEVAEKKGHPVLKFLKKFWGISAWMLEAIMVEPPSDLTPQLVKRVHQLYEELGREKVRAVQELEQEMHKDKPRK